MNKYLLFAGKTCYSSGGLSEYITSFETIESATIIGDKLIGDDLGYYACSWYQVVDSSTMKEVVKDGGQLYNSTTLDDIRGLGEELEIGMVDSSIEKSVKTAYDAIMEVIGEQ